MTDRLASNTRTVSLLTMLSRVTGLARDAALSRVFGAGPLISAFFFAFMIPNLFRRLFGEGALAAAFLPQYARLEHEEPETARALASMTIAMLVTGLGVVTLLLELALMLVASSTSEPSPTVVFAMVMLPYMPLVCVVAILGAMLQVHGRFAPSAAAPIVLNICLIGATIVPVAFAMDDASTGGSPSLTGLRHLMLVGGSIIIAGVIQVGWALWALRRNPWWTRAQQSARPHAHRMLRVAGPMIVSLGVLQLNTFFDGVIASYPVTFETDTLMGVTYPLDGSAMAILSYAQRLYQFPLGVFGIAVATAIFPLLAAQVHDGATFASTLRRGLRLVVYIGLPASAGLILVRDPLTAVIYRGGAFTAEEGDRVAEVLTGYAPAIWAYSMTHVLNRAFYAHDDSARPMRIAMWIVLLNLVLNISLIWMLREVGLAVSTAVCAVVQVICLLVTIQRHAQGVVNRAVMLSWLRSLIATCCMVALVLGLDAFLPDPGDRWIAQAGTLALMTITGGIAFAFVSWVLRMPEMWWALGFARADGVQTHDQHPHSDC